MSWDNLEDAFKDIDKNEFRFLAEALSSYRKSLMDEGFTRREAARLVESFAKYIYDMALEDFMVEKAREDVDGPDDLI